MEEKKLQLKRIQQFSKLALVIPIFGVMIGKLLLYYAGPISVAAERAVLLSEIIVMSYVLIGMICNFRMKSLEEKIKEAEKAHNS